MATLQLREHRDGDVVRLSSPSVGHFTCAVPPGRALVAGQVAGVLVTLGRSFDLIVPEGVSGVVRGESPELVHAPVGYGTLLYELGALAADTATAGATANASSNGGALLFRSPSSGRFWHRTTPGDPPLVQAGDLVEVGRAVGLIEVMKTFTLLHYAAGAGLPPRARVVRLLAGDGAEVAEKAALFELEPA